MIFDEKFISFIVPQICYTRSMTNLAFMSDLHLDSNQFTDEDITILIDLLKKKKVDHIHFAGDLSNDFEHISLPFLQKLKKSFSVSYNLGNHDMLGMTEDDIQQHNFNVQSFGQTQFISLAGWYDYGFVPEKTPEEHKRTKQFFWFDRRLNRNTDDPILTQQTLEQLERILTSLNDPIILAMHFVPHKDFLYNHPYFQRFNPFLGNQAFHELFVKYGVKDVVFGHLHHRHSARMIDSVCYHTRPLGYIREWQLTQQFFEDYPQYKISQMYRLHKRYNAVKDLSLFQSYKKKHLQKELEDALIIFDI